MNKNGVFMGLLFILVAIVMMGSAMGFLPDIPWFKLLCGVVLVSWCGKSLWKRDFFGGFVSLGILAWIFESELGIDELVPFPLLIAAGLVGIGLNMIFGKKPIVTITSDGRTMTVDELKAQNKWEDGRHVVLENVFSQTSKYVNSVAFSSATLENVFGSANIYFDNAVMANNVATTSIENVFGTMNIYLPKNWRVNVKQEAVFGSVHVYGQTNHDMDAPYLDINVESVFGTVNIYLE